MALNGASGRLEVTKNRVDMTSSGHGVDIQKCRKLHEALNLLRSELEDHSGAFLLAKPRVHLGLRLGAIALAEGLITEKVGLPGLEWLLGFIGKKNWYDGYITIDGVVYYPLTVYETNFVSGRNEIQVGW